MTLLNLLEACDNSPIEIFNTEFNETVYTERNDVPPIEDFRQVESEYGDSQVLSICPEVGESGVPYLVIKI